LIKNLIASLQNDVLAHCGADSFEEAFKLIFVKLYDEVKSSGDFRTGETDETLFLRLSLLLSRSAREFADVFPRNATFDLSPAQLSHAVRLFSGVKLLDRAAEAFGEAFEVLTNKQQKDDRGQFFTPSIVTRMCVRALNPKPDEYLIDIAAGSGGFLLESFEKSRNLFAIELDERLVRICRAINHFALDGSAAILPFNALNYAEWEGLAQEKAELLADYSRLASKRAANDDKAFNFDVLFVNPPFAGEISDLSVLERYEIAKRDGKLRRKQPADVLFIERALDFLKPGGRAAIILPQGRFNNSSDLYVRDFIAKRCRICAVVGLHPNAFKPHTGTKASVIFVQKWDGRLCPKTDDYPIFFATSNEGGKDNSGKDIYETIQGGEPRRVVKHDLFNYEGKTNGIAEAFIAFAKDARISFA
jgi:type I restriction enzyme M protein